MSNGQYNNEDKGVLWANAGQTNPQAPAVTGKLQLSRAMLKKLVEDMNNNLPAIVRLAGWTQQKQGTNEFFTQLKASDWDHNFQGGRQPTSGRNTLTQQMPGGPPPQYPAQPAPAAPMPAAPAPVYAQPAPAPQVPTGPAPAYPAQPAPVAPAPAPAPALAPAYTQPAPAAPAQAPPFDDEIPFP